jgi:hypothetical protein
VDVRQALHDASRRLSLSELARGGPGTISVVSKARIAELINRAVCELVERTREEEAPRRERAERAAARAEEARGFYERLAELAREVELSSRAREELEATRCSLLEEIGALRGEIERETARAAEKREDALDRSEYLGVTDFDRRLATIVAEACRARDPGPGEGSPAAHRKDADRLETLLRELVLRVTREERARLRAPLSPTQGLWKSEKRVEKLYSQLDALERALRLVSSSKVQNHPTVQAALRELGLVSDDKYHEKKQEMLKVVLDNNREIRRRHRDLAARGITLSSPGPVQ